MPKSINLSEIKRKFERNTIVYRRTFPGVSSVHMNHHIMPTLLEDNPDIVIVHAGINDKIWPRPDYQKYPADVHHMQKFQCQSSYNFGHCFL